MIYYLIRKLQTFNDLYRLLFQKNIELYEGENGGLVFQLAHPGSETLTFCADNDNICEKWIAAINEAVQMDP